MQVMIQNAIITPRLSEKNGITELVLFSSSLSMLREENLKISIPGNLCSRIKVKNASSHLVPLQRKKRKIRIEKWKIKKIHLKDQSQMFYCFKGHNATKTFLKSHDTQLLWVHEIFEGEWEEIINKFITCFHESWIYETWIFHVLNESSSKNQKRL